MRKIIDYPDVEPEFKTPKPLEYEISLITPLFGGGVTAGEVDPTMPIRVSSIRGHLRFWWRATRGANFDTFKELKAREGEIWGTTEIPSKVEIEIKDLQLSSKDINLCAEFKEETKNNGDFGFFRKWNPMFAGNNKDLQYVLFPFQGETKKIYHPETRENVETIIKFPGKFILNTTFKLNFSLYKENIRPDLECAIWAWVNFGGIGARTRRGCGSLFCKSESPPDVSSIGKWYQEKLKTYGITGGEQRPWPTLPKTLLIKPGNEPNSIVSWSKGIEVFKSYRQAPQIGRNLGMNINRPGRSRWPEPEAIRNLICEQRRIRRPIHWHKPEGHINRRAFPRAAFGMPIIFEIRDECLNPTEQNGRVKCRISIKPTLTPDTNHDRMASPLIIKAIKTSKDAKSTSLILRLCTPDLQSAYLRKGPEDLLRDYQVPASELSNPENVNYANHPVFNRSNTGSALEGFVSFAQEKKQGFIEVGQEKII